LTAGLIKHRLYDASPDRFHGEMLEVWELHEERRSAG